MLLLARSALCIGLVVAALPEGPVAAKRLPVAGGEVAAAATRLCGRDPVACARFVGALAPAPSAPRSASPRS